jgi:spore coat polysaccharide biosynthesis protein SpsF
MAARVGVIIQARCDSSRLPGKALAALGGVSILTRCLVRLRRADVGPVVLATTERPIDDALVVIARRMGVAVFRGSTTDVLQRSIDAAVCHEFDVVRATGDNPAVDIDAAARVLETLRIQAADYACEDGLPYGAGVECVTTDALLRATALARRASDREHVTTYIKAEPTVFRVSRIAAPERLHRPTLRLTIDTAADLAFMRRVYAEIKAAELPLAEIIAAADACSRSDAA